MTNSDLELSVKAYILEHVEVSRNELMEYFEINSGVLHRILKSLENNGVIRTKKEGKKVIITAITDYESDEAVIKIPISAKHFNSLSSMRTLIRKQLRQHNWSSITYSLPTLALLIAKHTNLRLIIIGSQAVGKTSCIRAVFQDTDRILFDMHRKNLYQYINEVKEYTKVIEQQYIHNWKYEDTKEFDKFSIVPISKIGPSEFLFRFLPLRITQPCTVRFGFKQVYFELTNFKLVKKLPESLQEKLQEELNNLRYFTINEGIGRLYMEQLKQDDITRLYSEEDTESNLNAKQWRVERKYEALLKDSLMFMNHPTLRNIDELWHPVGNDLQMTLNAFEIARFAYSLSGDENLTVKETVSFMKEIIDTWTETTFEKTIRAKEVKSSGTQSHYVDSAGVVHNVV